MTRRRAARLVLVLAACAAAGGCLRARPAPQIRYYTVALATDGRRLPMAVQVRGFTAVPAYRTTRLAFRRSRYRLDYFDFHRWAANPQSLLAAAVQRWFDRIDDPNDADPVRVSGRIDRLEAVKTSNGLRAVVVLAFEAVGPAGTMFERTYLEKQPVEGEDPEQVVAAISHALERILSRLATDLVATRQSGRPAARS
jgi:ABC-type uncharacterized transport system auxiliary subunit